MAPQKTIAISQQEQSQQQNVGSVKPRKRKGNKQQQSIANIDHTAAQNQPNNNAFDCAKSMNNKQQVGNKIDNNSNPKSSNHVDNKSSAKQQVLHAQTTRATVKAIEPTERTSVAKSKQQENQVPKQPVKEAIVPSRMTITTKHLSTEEPDDIDAGIELDGSSNSGSSVKDINEDQSKSASVSPIMAQSNENRSSTTQHAVELAPVEQLAGSMCRVIGPVIKKASTTMQKLAANQEVIEADEQQLQQKMHSKQRASSLKSSLDTKTASYVALDNGNISSTVVASPQSPALCKICEQHVYQMERVMAEKSVYHKGCFRCHQCKVQLRVDNYSSHEGQVYCKAHHRQLFRPQVKLDSEEDVDIVAKSTSKVVDDYLLQRGRLSELSFSFLNPKPEEMRKRQMIICENEPAELPKDVVRSDTKVDDGIDRLNLNLNNILKRFEQGSGEQEQPSSAGVVIDKPSFDIKKTLMAFETNAVKSENESEDVQEKPKRRVIKKLTNLDGFLNRQSSQENDSSGSGDSAVSITKPLAVRRSESLMMRLKKYESRINGEQVANEDSDVDDESKQENGGNKLIEAKQRIVPKKLTSLKNQWENGDISKKSFDEADAAEANAFSRNEVSDSINGNSPLAEKNEELIKIRQQLARKKSGESASIKNIYENAIKEAQQQKRTISLNSSDLSALNGYSTTEIQQQLLQNGNKISQNTSTPSSSTPNKDHFQLNLNKRANRLKERFEQGLINNCSIDDSDASNGDDDDKPTMTKMEQLRQEKLEDLSIFTEGEVKAREARSLFQQIDRRLSAASIGSPVVSSSRSPASISASMSSRLRGRMSENSQTGELCNGDNNLNNATPTVNNTMDNRHQQQPIRLTNNVRT